MEFLQHALFDRVFCTGFGKKSFFFRVFLGYSSDQYSDVENSANRKSAIWAICMLFMNEIFVKVYSIKRLIRLRRRLSYEEFNKCILVTHSILTSIMVFHWNNFSLFFAQPFDASKLIEAWISIMLKWLSDEMTSWTIPYTCWTIRCLRCENLDCCNFRIFAI